jgi:hypothetical protein
MAEQADRRTEIGGRSLEVLRNHYRRYLVEEYLPFWDGYVQPH